MINEDDIKKYEDFQLLESIFDYAAEYNIKICTAKYSDRHKQGIHLLTPTSKELLEAVNSASVDGFMNIWCHNKTQVELKLIKGGRYNDY